MRRRNSFVSGRTNDWKYGSENGDGGAEWRWQNCLVRRRVTSQVHDQNCQRQADVHHNLPDNRWLVSSLQCTGRMWTRSRIVGEWFSRHLKQFLWSEWSKIGNSSTHHDEDSRRIIIKSTITGGCASLKEFIIQFFKEKTKYENSVLVKKHSGRLRVILKADSESLSNDRRNLKHTVLLWNTSPLQIWKDWIQRNWERTSPKGWRVWTFLTVLI